MPASRRCSASRSTAASASRRKGEITSVTRRYRAGHADPRNALRDRRRRRDADRLHADPRPQSGLRAHRRRRARPRADVRRADPALRLRRDRSLGAQARRRHAARDRRPRHGGAAHAGAPARREHDHGRRIHRGRRRSRAVRAELRAVASAACRKHSRPMPHCSDTESFWQRMDAQGSGATARGRTRSRARSSRSRR